MIGGLLTKLLGMGIKILETRLIGTEGIGLFMMINPTFSLLLAIAGFSLPVAISTLVAREEYDNKRLVLSMIPFCLGFNGILFLILFFGRNFLAGELLHEVRLSPAILSIGFVLPFISLSSILRGYFFGKEKMFPHALSNVLEDIVRLILLATGIPVFLVFGLEYAVAFLILSNIASELTQILVLIIFLPKGFHIEKKDFIPRKKEIKEVFQIAFPTTVARVIGSIGYFLEPILLTNVLLKVGYTNSFITNEYGIIEGYVMPLLLLPSFFTMAISQALIPTISNAYAKGKLIYARKKMKQAIFFSLLVGIPSTLLFTIFPEFFLHALYHTTKGSTYLKVIAPFFLLFYIQAPLTAALQGTGKSRLAMRGSLIGVCLRTFLIFFLTHFKIGMWGLIIAMLSNIFFVTLHQGYQLNKILKSEKM